MKNTTITQYVDCWKVIIFLKLLSKLNYTPRFLIKIICKIKPEYFYKLTYIFHIDVYSDISHIIEEINSSSSEYEYNINVSAINLSISLHLKLALICKMIDYEKLWDNDELKNNNGFCVPSINQLFFIGYQ